MESIVIVLVAPLVTYVIGSIPKNKTKQLTMTWTETIEAAYNTKQWQVTRAASVRLILSTLLLLGWRS